MRKSRFSEEQIIGILKEHQAGMGAKELCRKHGIHRPAGHCAAMSREGAMALSTNGVRSMAAWKCLRPRG